MRLGITATRKGLSDGQWEALDHMVPIVDSEVTELHHGMCTGGDEQIVDELDRPDLEIVAHPGPRSRYQSDRARWASTRVLPEKDFIARNHDIVHSVDELWAFPEGPEKKRGSGTWATIRYARDIAHIPVIIFWPNGQTEVV